MISPLTEADIAASKIINKLLETGTYPIINEENKNRIYSERKDWETCWIVDPLGRYKRIY